jgi:hypothetical protein
MVNYLRADTPADPIQWSKLVEAHTDITGAAVVEVKSSPSQPGTLPVLWVNVNGVCVLRICRIEQLFVQEKLVGSKDPNTDTQAGTQTGTLPVLGKPFDKINEAASSIRRGTHDSCPTRLLPQSEEARTVDGWWMDYFASQQKSHRELAIVIQEQLTLLRKGL